MAKVLNFIQITSPPSMLFRRIFTSLARSDLKPSFIPKDIISSSFPISSRFDQTQFRFTSPKEVKSSSSLSPPHIMSSDNHEMKNQETRRHILPPITSDKMELLRGLESAVGSSFSSDPLSPPPHPLVIVISGPSGVGKDAVIKKLREVREGIHFVVTATSREMRPGEVEGKDYYFVSKERFLEMVKQDELLEYALVYGDYKGIPKQQIRDFMMKGYDIILRVDIQGAATLRRKLGDSAVFIFLVAESELALVNRLIDRKTETSDKLLVRINTAREEVKHMTDFDYVVVNAEGKLDNAVKLVESIIDAEKAKERSFKICSPGRHEVPEFSLLNEGREWFTNTFCIWFFLIRCPLCKSSCSMRPGSAYGGSCLLHVLLIAFFSIKPLLYCTWSAITFLDDCGTTSTMTAGRVY